MMTDLELGLWLLSPQERDMLKQYLQSYWQEYGDAQEHQTQKGTTQLANTNRKSIDTPSHNSPPQHAA